MYSSVLISQLKGAVHPLVLTNQGISKPPPVLSFITLITYLLSFTLAWSCPWLAVAYPSHHLTALVLTYQQLTNMYIGKNAKTRLYIN